MDNLLENGISIITTLWSINPILGAASVVLFLTLLIFLSIKVKSANWIKKKDEANSELSDSVKDGQDTTKNVQDKIDSWLNN